MAILCGECRKEDSTPIMPASTAPEITLPERNVFVCSAAYSGSTLLDMLLGSHPAAESLGELINLPMDLAIDKNCACGTSVRSCSLWSRVVPRVCPHAARDYYALNLGYALASFGDPKRTSRLYKAITRPKVATKYFELRFGLRFLRALTPGFTEGIRNTLAVYEQVRELTGKRVIVDSSKHYVRAAALYLAAPEKTRVVLLVRDGRGAFHSGMKRGFRRERALRGWRNHYRRALALLPRLVPEEHRLLVRYEDIAQRPAATLTRVCDFVGIPFEPAMLEFRDTIHHNVNGNNMKFRSAAKLRLEDSWRNALSPADLDYFERRAGAINRQFGYTPISRSGELVAAD
jgi:hypothetical protein